MTTILCYDTHDGESIGITDPTNISIGVDGNWSVYVDVDTNPPTVQFFYTEEGEQVSETYQVNVEDECVERVG